MCTIKNCTGKVGPDQNVCIPHPFLTLKKAGNIMIFATFPNNAQTILGLVIAVIDTKETTADWKWGWGGGNSFPG